MVLTIFRDIRLEPVFDDGSVGGWMAADPRTLSAAARLDALLEVARQQARLAAVEQRLLAAAARDTAEVPFPVPAGEGRRWVRDELACALNLSGGVIDARLHIAQALVECLPQTLAELAAGARGLCPCAGDR
jgi:hypothetical protein